MKDAVVLFKSRFISSAAQAVYDKPVDPLEGELNEQVTKYVQPVEKK
jgi:hypothetical protein